MSKINENFDVTDLTNEAISEATTLVLRAWATAANLPDYYRNRTVASVDLSDEVIRTPGVLAKTDALLTALTGAYKGQDPKVVRRTYGTSLELVVWVEDDSLRMNLRSYRDRVAKEREQAEQDKPAADQGYYGGEEES